MCQDNIFNPDKMKTIDFTCIDFTGIDPSEFYEFKVPLIHDFYIKHKVLDILNNLHDNNFSLLTFDNISYEHYILHKNEIKLFIATSLGCCTFVICYDKTINSDSMLKTPFRHYLSVDNPKLVNLSRFCSKIQIDLDNNFKHSIINHYYCDYIYTYCDDLLEIYLSIHESLPLSFNIIIKNDDTVDSQSIDFVNVEFLNFSLFIELLYIGRRDFQVFQEVFNFFDVDNFITVDEIVKFYHQCIIVFKENEFKENIREQIELVNMLTI